ncbi:MAG: hypothetical protein R2991_02320 [Thermoanaerobaculia bacterium]
MADVIAYEVTLLLYVGLVGRRAEPPAAGTFTSHREIRYGAVAAVMLCLTAVEVGIIHLVATRFGHPRAAWALTALGVWGGLWLLGDWNALRLRPTRLEGDRLALRLGLRWEADIPCGASAPPPGQGARARRAGSPSRCSASPACCSISTHPSRYEVRTACAAGRRVSWSPSTTRLFLARLAPSRG